MMGSGAFGPEDRFRTNPPLAFTDACILAGLVLEGRWSTLGRVVIHYEYLARSTPSFDDFSFGIPRLIANALAEARVDSEGSMLLRATPAGVALFPMTAGVIDATMEMATTLGISVENPSEPDGSLGRVEGLTEAAFNRAADPSEEWQRKVDSVLPEARRGLAPRR
jgi:hypothetical protein